jgi:hypothetical protein
MDTRTSDLLGWVLLLAAIAAVFFLLVWGSQYKCEHRWAQSGMKSRWELGAGCLVQRKDGTWVPADNMKDLK